MSKKFVIFEFVEGDIYRFVGQFKKKKEAKEILKEMAKTGEVGVLIKSTDIKMTSEM